jgi:hypothetical protein
MREFSNNKTIIDNIQKKKRPSLSDESPMLIAHVTVLALAVVEPMLNHLYICPMTPYGSTMLRFLNPEAVQWSLISLQIHIVVVQEHARRQPIEICDKFLRSGRTIFDFSLLFPKLSGSENVTATIAIENRLREMFVAFVFFVAIIQPGWSTDASKARALPFVERFLAGHTQISAVDAIVQLPGSCAVVGIEHGAALCDVTEEPRWVLCGASVLSPEMWRTDA